MNYYFLLEDEKSFFKVLPKWLEYMGFEAKRVADIKEVTENCYVMQSGQGVTQLITRVLYQTIDTILMDENKGRIDELIIILDSEEMNVGDRKNDVKNKIDKYLEEKGYIEFSYKIFVCNHCFETWLLGNQKLYPEVEPLKESDFWEYYNYYNVKSYDPELMISPNLGNETTATYHFHYLHEMCRYNKIRYSKSKPDNLAKEEYFNELVTRIEITEHLKSFLEFYEYFKAK